MTNVPKFLSNHAFPTDITDDITAMVRVNLAGEESAVTIYEGQYKALQDDPIAPTILEMKTHEEDHRTAFREWAGRVHARPSLFGMVWKAAGKALGYGAGILGPSYAMAQTEAVEAVIEEHYAEQICMMPPGAFRDLLIKCQAEEAEHKHLGSTMRKNSLALDGWMALTRFGTRLAIKVAKRI